MRKRKFETIFYKKTYCLTGIVHKTLRLKP